MSAGRFVAGAVAQGSRAASWLWVVLVVTSSCGPETSDLPPDRRLELQLGLEPTDRVHQVTLTGGASGGAVPPQVNVLPGDYLQFVTGDSWVHEVVFESDSLSDAAGAFMADLDQLESPPLVSRGSRFVLSFVDAPEGRYPYRVEGNGETSRGVVVVTSPQGK
jgi:plastocyanin